MSIRFQTVLYPTDFSPCAESVVGHVRLVVSAFQAQLHCLHVVDEAYQCWSAMGPESVPVGPSPDEVAKLAQEHLEKFCTDELSDLGCRPIVQVAAGRPFAEIIGYSLANNVDLIVMATHGRGAIAHMLLGSTTEKVVRKAPCPVLTIRPDGQEFLMP